MKFSIFIAIFLLVSLMSFASSDPQQGLPIALRGRPRPPQRSRIVPGLLPDWGRSGGQRREVYVVPAVG